MSFARKIRNWGGASVATFATDGSKNQPESTPDLRSVATDATVARGSTFKNEVDEIFSRAANDPVPDPDRWCWPNTPAMNSIEIDTFATRLSMLTKRGLHFSDAEALADKLMVRDREQDDRVSCLECRYLNGFGAGRCANWSEAAVSRYGLIPEFVCALQRCPGFKATLHITTGGTQHD